MTTKRQDQESQTTVNLDELESKSLAVRGTCDHELSKEAWVAFRYSANPSTILELIAEVRKLREEVEDDYRLVQKQGKLLTGVVNAIKGEPPELTLWSHHDAPDLARNVVAELASLRGMVPVLSREELVTLRQWFHVVQDTNPGYLEEKDGVLAGKISSALSALPHPPAREGEKE